MEMLEKVILTKEQAEIIEKIKRGNQLSKKFARAIIEGYEIEEDHPTYKPGDIVVSIITGNVYKLLAPHDGGWYEGEVLFSDIDNSGLIARLAKKNIRHATKKEVFWAELGRDVEEFKEGDAIYTVHDSIFIIDELRAGEEDFISLEGAKRKSVNSIKGIYPAESFKRFSKE